MDAMAEFCTNCGAPLSGVFCGRCGHRAQSATAPAQPAVPNAQAAQPVAAAQPPSSQPSSLQQPAASQPPTAQPSVPQQSVPQQNVPQQTRPQPSQPPLAQPSASQPLAAQPPKSSGAGKALLIVGGILLVLALSAFGAVFYGIHWFKNKVSSVTGGSFGSEVAQGNMCRLLSTAELQQTIGVTVERSAEIMDNGDPGCAYYTNPAAFNQLQKRAIEQARRDSEKVSHEPGANAKGVNAKNNNDFVELMKHTKEMEGIVKGFGLSAPDPSGRVFAFSVNRNFDSSSWWTLRTTLSVVPGFDEVNGVGDHAMIGSFGHAFYVLKGNSMFKLETMALPEARTRGSEIANKLISHL
jgi:hypothetical protein